jgi:general secretion pathway protein D
VEATILEVSVTKQRKLGAAFHLPVSAGDGQVAVVGSQHPQIGTTSAEAVQGSLVGAAAALFSTAETTFLGMTIPSFGVLVNAIQTEEDVNVLSAPQLLAVDGKPAHLKVGENVPVPRSVGTTGDSGLPTAAVTQVDRTNVGLSLGFTAFVNEGGQIQLDLEQTSNELSELDPTGLGPTWQERSLTTTVLLEDQQPVVIGGLMIDRVGVSRSKVPLLGDIPLVGALFRWQQESKKKRNLLIFLTPYVVDGHAEAQRLMERKMRERDEFERAWSSLHGEGARRLAPVVDYRKKRGLVAEIARRVQAADAEATELRKAETPSDRGERGVLRIGP